MVTEPVTILRIVIKNVIIGNRPIKIIVRIFAQIFSKVSSGRYISLLSNSTVDLNKPTDLISGGTTL